MARLQEALAGNREVREQAACLLRQLSYATYADGGASAGKSPIGVHFRRLLEHYRALVDGLADGRVDYEARNRRGALERNRELALEEVLRVRRALDDVAEQPSFGLAPSTIAARRPEVSGARDLAAQR